MTNPEVIAVDQHSSGNRPVIETANTVIWTAVEGGVHMVAVFNLKDTPATIMEPWKVLGLDRSSYRVRDLWQREELGTQASLRVSVPPHGAFLVLDSLNVSPGEIRRKSRLFGTTIIPTICPNRNNFGHCWPCGTAKAHSALRGYLRARGDVAEVSPARGIHEAVRSQKPELDCARNRGRQRAHGLSSPRVLRDFDRRSHATGGRPCLRGCEAGCGDTVDSAHRRGGSEARLSALLESLAGGDAGGLGDQTQRAGQASGADGEGLPGVFNSSARMMEIRDTIEKVATTNATVLIRGESGVGKEIAARTIFSLSHRRQAFRQGELCSHPE